MMKLFARMVGSVATAMTCCAVLSSLAGMWLNEEGSALRLPRCILFEMRRSQALRDRTEAFHRAVQAKQRIIAALVEGRLRLREAIDQFQRINKDLLEAVAREDVEPGMVAACIVPTDPESVGRQVLDWARVAVAFWPPDKSKCSLADFERELGQLFGRPSLPDFPADTSPARQAVD